MQSLTPNTFSELAQALACLDEGDKIVAGGTDFVIQLRHGKYKPERVLYLGDIPQLRKITVTDEQVRIGSMATMTEIADSLELVPEFMAVADAASDVGSPQVRNKATMAGNLCNASPAGDMLPVSWLLDAKAEIVNSEGVFQFLSESWLKRASFDLPRGAGIGGKVREWSYTGFSYCSRCSCSDTSTRRKSGKDSSRQAPCRDVG